MRRASARQGVAATMKTFDLNLLRVFDAMMSEHNMTAAGARLGLTQPAMSHALKRMREQCNDPLFVRTTGGMTPTEYARGLAGPISQAIGVISNALEANVTFSPASSTRTFRLLMTDAAGVSFLPRLIPYLQKVAPGVTVVAMQQSREQYRHALESGAADLAIGQLPEIQRDFHQQHLYDEAMVCLLRRDHPKIGRNFSLRQFIEAGHVIITAPAHSDGLVKRALGKRAARRRIALQVPHHMAVPLVLSGSDLIAVVAKTVAEVFLPMGQLKVLPLPFPVQPVEVRQFWHKRSHYDPGHKWLRGTIASLFMANKREPGRQPA